MKRQKKNMISNIRNLKTQDISYTHINSIKTKSNKPKNPSFQHMRTRVQVEVNYD